MSKKQQIWLAILLILSLIYFIGGMISENDSGYPLWHRTLGLLGCIIWGTLLFSVWKSKQKK
ncbi:MULTISPECIES: hypothetical protein [Peribacillus]|uniref:Uncharacterized protein n=1 Tax=Peribacillus simplex TaxID=1478 RepID=A0A109MY33_9BACI|nr:hypothetical protein [Peribacillus simplex]KWW18866.1 hypothetical protein AS888_19690 [Peribacillus simplex]